ncbi:MAG: hypothetical protein KBS80_01070 [Bacteroidales bacterium]|nr:hypothetical protein [Candidatus Cryptobacteroides choladohippi]
MRRFVIAIVAAILILFTGENLAYAQLSKLHFKGYKITRIAPTSLRSVRGTAEFNCINDSLGFTMSNIKGTVYKKGVAFISGSADPVSVPSGSSAVTVNGKASLCDGIGLWDVLQCIAFKAEDYSIDVSMTVVNSKGNRREYSKMGMSVSALLNNIRKKK